jgi:hypothetical protein
MFRRSIVKLMGTPLLWAADRSSRRPPIPDTAHSPFVSLIQVIANPKDFDGLRIRVCGYLGGNGLDKSLGIYVSELDGRVGVISNSIDLWLHSNEDEKNLMSLSKNYVIFSAVYHAPRPLSDFNGGFDQIRDLRRWAAGDNVE